MRHWYDVVILCNDMLPWTHRMTLSGGSVLMCVLLVEDDVT